MKDMMTMTGEHFKKRKGVLEADPTGLKEIICYYLSDDFDRLQMIKFWNTFMLRESFAGLRRRTKRNTYFDARRIEFCIRGMLRQLKNK